MKKLVNKKETTAPKELSVKKDVFSATGEEKTNKVKKNVDAAEILTVAKVKFLRMSHRKADLVVAAVRGMRALDALEKLVFLNKKASLPIAKMIKSAIANAEHNSHLAKENLYIKSIVSNQGPALKRFKPAAFGTAHAIKRRLCHLEVVLTNVKPVKKNNKKANRNNFNLVEKKRFSVKTEKATKSIKQVKK